MENQKIYFAISALFIFLAIITILKNNMLKVVFSTTNRYILILMAFLLNILVLMFLCSSSQHCNASYCIFFVGFVPFLIFYYCLHLIIKTINGTRNLLQGKEFELLSLFFLIPYVPTFLEITQQIFGGNIYSEIHKYEIHIFIVTNYLLFDILSSLFKDA